MTDAPEKRDRKITYRKTQKTGLKKSETSVRNDATTLKRKRKEFDSSDEESYSTASGSSELSDEVFQSEQMLNVTSIRKDDFV